MADGEKLPMNEVVPKVLEAFQEPSFARDLEVFVNCNIPLFSQVTQDGSFPLEWTFQHKKYKQLYESQLQKALDSHLADFTEFVDYMQQCSNVYGADASFQALRAALTASEDFNAFLQVMFNAVRENWEPEPDAAPAPPNVQVHSVDVTIPEGVVPGQAMSIDYLGMTHTVVVPEGVAPGSLLRVQLQVPMA